MLSGTKFPWTFGICWAVLFTISGCSDQEDHSSAEEDHSSDIFIHPGEAETFPGFRFQGEYTGDVRLTQEQDPVKAGLQIAVYGENTFRALLYIGGLPGDHLNTGGSGLLEEVIELKGSYSGHILHLESVDSPLNVRKIHEHYAILDSDYNYLGHLNPIKRESSTSGMNPPEDAIVLFSGEEEELALHWDDDSEMTGNLLKQGATTRESFGDMRLHLEAQVGFMPMVPDQERTNSGIYIQNRYEVQIIDSFALLPALNSNASLYNEVTPAFNPTFPPLDWQTYDVYFRAPRFDDAGQKTENSRVTVYLNGFLVIDDAELEQGTGAGARFEETAAAELYLQDHTGPVRFRNIWLVEEEYSPPGVSRLIPNERY